MSDFNAGVRNDEILYSKMSMIIEQPFLIILDRGILLIYVYYIINYI